MGLFDKKHCDVCGEKIGLLGNRKLEDGNLCKACAAKLSPWFSERKNSTVDEIKGQLQYREDNKAAVAAFNTTRTLGVNTKVLLDEVSRKFMVTSARNLAEANPDVLDYSQITGCRLDVQESKSEMKQRTLDGKEVSYNPPQYKHSYNFCMVINVNHPYFNEMHFQLNPSTVTIEPTIHTAPRPAAPMARPAAAPARPAVAPGNRPSMAKGGVNAPRPGAPTARPVAAPAAPARPAAQPAPQPARVISSTTVDPRTNVEYAKYQKMGDDIVAALTQVQEDVREEIAASNAPQQAVTCPWCGATTIPDANGCCEYCGGAVNA